MITGKFIRLNRIFKNKKVLFVALDSSLIDGPRHGLEDMENLILQISKAKPDALLCYKGTLIRHISQILEIPIILNISASTIRGQHLRKTLIGSVEESMSMGADAVALNLNVSSMYEYEMLNTLGKISRECEILGMPLMINAYPRTEQEDENYNSLKQLRNDDYTSFVSHCVRIASDLGADIVKTQFTGSAESFHSVVQENKHISVVAAGGVKINSEDLLANTRMLVQAGAAGVCYGRNIYSSPELDHTISNIKNILSQ